MLIKLKRGLDLRMAGAPEQSIYPAPPLSSVALVGTDYADLRDSLAVAQGERVRLGQTLFTDRRHSEIRYTAPGAGLVRAIHRGARRRLTSIVIDLDGDDAELFASHTPHDLEELSVEAVKDNLLNSGLWTALRTRPYDRVPKPEDSPETLFVTAMDTNPLAADPAVVIAEHPDDFRHGLTVLTRLATGNTYVCKSPSTDLATPIVEGLVLADFEGPHPAGLPGTHIHWLAPDATAAAWHIGYQDVIAIGRLFLSGKICPERVVALSGAGVVRPRLVRARLGASLHELLDGGYDADGRIISGSVLSGRRATQPVAHLGRYHDQVTVLPEIRHRGRRSRLLAMLTGGGQASRPSDTAVNGHAGGMLPLEAFERVWPLRMPPAPLLRALLVRDLATARALGCLSLAEEDLALCSFVCPAKYDYGSALRATLRAIERST